MPTPLTKQRSLWRECDALDIGDVTCRVWQRDVGDGHLMAIIGDEPMGWHMSISHRTNQNPPRPGRYPRWDEITHARYELLTADLDFVMHLPPPGEYVDLHATTFHLHEHPERAS